MSKSESKKWINVVGRLLLAYALIFTQSALAGQNQKTKAAADSAQKAAAQQTGDKQSSAATPARAKADELQREPSKTAVAEEKSLSNGSHEGIKVHGHWTIEVLNPDGTLVTHREFENSLHPLAPPFLSNLLSRQISPGLWSVQVGGPSQPCANPGSSTSACTISEPNLNGTGGDFQTLRVSASNGTFVLSGTAVAAQSGNISGVSTFNYSCINTTAPSSPCTLATALNPAGNLTAATLTSPISVAGGQTISVIVVISFS